MNKLPNLTDFMPDPTHDMPDAIGEGGGSGDTSGTDQSVFEWTAV